MNLWYRLTPVVPLRSHCSQCCGWQTVSVVQVFVSGVCSLHWDNEGFITCVWLQVLVCFVLFFLLLVTGDIYLNPEESIWVLSQKAAERRRIA